MLDGPSAATNRLGASADKGESVDVPVMTLDEVLEAQGLTPSVMKVDVEGAELLLLRGASSTLRVARPVIVLELHWGRSLGATPESILKLTREYDYVLCGAGGRVDSAEALLAQNFVIMRPVRGKGIS